MTLPSLALLALLTSLAVAAEQPAVFSGPQVGEKLPPLKVALVSGEDAARTVDLVELAADRPLLLVFAGGPNGPAGLLARALMNFADMHREKLAAGVVYLSNERSDLEKFLQQQGEGWWAALPGGAAAESLEGPGNYGLNRNVTVTVIVGHKGVVTANVPLVQPALTDAKEILREVVRLAGGTVPTEAELAYLSMPTRYATTNPKLRALLCDCLAAGDEAAAGKAAAAVDAYVASDKTRQADLGNALLTFLTRRPLRNVGDLPCAEHLRRWQKEYSPPGRQKRR